MQRADFSSWFPPLLSIRPDYTCTKMLQAIQQKTYVNITISCKIRTHKYIFSPTPTHKAELSKSVHGQFSPFLALRDDRNPNILRLRFKSPILFINYFIN